MRIVVLGGAGTMGSAVVDDLVKSGVDEVVVADLNITAAQKVIEKYKKADTEVAAQFVDANVHESLVEVISGADVVSSNIGPFYEYCVKVVEAAIEAKVNLVDICDDFDAAEEAFKHDPQAKKAGITACIGCGASPGLSNMTAKYAATKMDRVDDILIAWAVSVRDTGGPAANYHILHSLSGKVPTYRNGKVKYIEAGSEKETVKFLDPIGEVEVYSFGHSEPLTLPRYIQGVRNVSIKGATLPVWLDEVFRRLSRSGFASKQPVSVKGVSIVPLDFAVSLTFSQYAYPQEIKDMIEKEAPIASAEKLIVTGERKGEPVKYTYDGLASFATTTAAAASVAAQMIASGKTTSQGVLPPEGCLDAREFLKEIIKRKIEIIETEEITRSLTKEKI
ncbi:MAG: saccharopine dehydrogenase NADP-binding domain-containing protein [Candidatus Jordarchaeum sp.]|uniref:saccharopine dehydrogenase NADP-binding domain-containing protein n=1 Tax=Candidatus Jordarchaeum sp. TaxID=2823881 RepID=UPI00404A1A91